MSAVRPTIEFGGRTIAVDVPHVAFATVIAAWCVWFCREAWISAPNVENLILIVPASTAAMIFYVFVAADCFHSVENIKGPTPAPHHQLIEGSGIKIAGTMAILTAFVIAAPLIGFDIAFFAYVLAMMAFLGERRIVVPLLFCIAAIYCFNTILATPLPLYFFAGDAS